VELVARYGIDRALLAVQQPDTDHPADRKVDVDHPWARVQALRRARTRLASRPLGAQLGVTSLVS
jgi:hypothetical protein